MLADLGARRMKTTLCTRRALSLWAGQSVGLVSEIKPAGDIVREIVAQGQSTLGKLAQ